MAQRLSFRDPAGFVVRDGARVLRAVLPQAVPMAERLLASPWLKSHMDAGRIPASHWVEAAPQGFEHLQARWLQHQPLDFPAYPHELAPAQLYDSARLTLTVALDALEHDWVLKDASAWNVLFDHGRPVFCDLLSFTPLEPAASWLAYAQFQRSYTIPLMLSAACGLAPRTWFLSERDGVTPEQARRLIPWSTAWRQPALEAITVPALLGGSKPRHARRAAPTEPPRVKPDVAKHVLRSTLLRLQRHIISLEPATSRSKWLDYRAQRPHYGSEDLRAKADFVCDALQNPRTHSVLDLGCNTGEYSELALAAGKTVVAVDSDDSSVEHLYKRSRAAGWDIGTFVLNIARPPGALGWMNAEVPAFLGRARGRFDAVLALGLLHHLIVTERVPVPAILELMAELTRNLLVVEWIERDDPRFQELAGPNLPLYSTLTRESFEASLAECFRVISRLELPSGLRCLYACARRSE